MNRQILLCVEYKSFYSSYQMLNSIGAFNGVNFNTLPCIINGAFATETALKCILSNKSIKYPPVHTLRSLFEILPSTIRKEILAELLIRIPQFSDQQIDDELYQISKAFEEWRYLGEYPNTMLDSVFFCAFVESVCSVTLKYFDIQITAGQTLQENNSEFAPLDEMFNTCACNHIADMKTAVERDRKKIQGNKVK